MKVLIAVDGSQGSFEAVDQIGRVLSGERDEVALYCAPPDLRVRARAGRPQIRGRRAATVLPSRFSTKPANGCRRRSQGRVKTIIGTHDARQGTLVAASEWAADLIAMGARGLNSLERLLLGSVSRAVVHRSAVPVWIARARAGRPPRGMNVLLACERPELGRPAAELAAKFTWPANTSFRALSVVRSILAGRMPDWLEQQPRTPDVEAMVQAWAREHDEDLRQPAGMEEFVRGLPPPLNTSQALIAEGEPAREILAAIQKENIDLVVLGSQTKRSVASIILGSTSEAVLNHAGCSVLVVPQRQVAGPQFSLRQPLAAGHLDQVSHAVDLVELHDGCLSQLLQIEARHGAGNLDHALGYRAVQPPQWRCTCCRTTGQLRHGEFPDRSALRSSNLRG